MKPIKLQPPRKYLLKYQKNSNVSKYYKITPIEITDKLIIAYTYSNEGTSPGVRSFKKDNIISIDSIKSL